MIKIRQPNTILVKITQEQLVLYTKFCYICIICFSNTESILCQALDEVVDTITTIDRGCVIYKVRMEAKETFNNLNTTIQQDRLFKSVPQSRAEFIRAVSLRKRQGQTRVNKPELLIPAYIKCHVIF